MSSTIIVSQDYASTVLSLVHSQQCTVNDGMILLNNRTRYESFIQTISWVGIPNNSCSYDVFIYDYDTNLFFGFTSFDEFSQATRILADLPRFVAINFHTLGGDHQTFINGWKQYIINNDIYLTKIFVWSLKIASNCIKKEEVFSIHRRFYCNNPNYTFDEWCRVMYPCCLRQITAQESLFDTL